MFNLFLHSISSISQWKSSKYGCFRASSAEIHFDGFNINNCLNKWTAFLF